jgi:D-lactate dehydrogenase
MSIRIAFFDAKPYDRDSFDLMNKKFNFEIKYFKYHLSPESVIMAKGFDVVCAFVNDQISEEIIQQLDVIGVKLIALRSAGYNNVDFKAAFGKIHVVRVPAYSPHAIAEHTVALMLTLNRKTHRAYARTREGNFALQGLLGFDFFGKTAGVIGTGKIGKALVTILSGFGMHVLAYDVFPDLEFAAAVGCTYTSLEELFLRSDVISLNCPLSKETEHLINEHSLAKMKDGVMLINTGRGKLIKAADLVEALKNGKVGYAGLDVYEEESEYFFEDKSDEVIMDDVLARLLAFNNVIITSHQGFFTREALANIADTTLQNIQDYIDGKSLENEICYQCTTDKKTCRKEEGKRCF